MPVGTLDHRSVPIVVGREGDGRRWADIESMPGAMAYGATRDSAIAVLILPFFEQERYEEILCLVFVSDLTPALECCFDRFDLLQHVRAAPFDRPVVIGSVAMLKHVHEGISNRMEVFENVKIVTRSRSGLELYVQLVAFRRTYPRHRRMVEHACHGEAFCRTLPILRSLRTQQMEEGVVRCGYRSPKTCLFGTLGLSIG